MLCVAAVDSPQHLVIGQRAAAVHRFGALRCRRRSRRLLIVMTMMMLLATMRQRVQSVRPPMATANMRSDIRIVRRPDARYLRIVGVRIAVGSGQPGSGGRPQRQNAGQNDGGPVRQREQHRPFATNPRVYTISLMHNYTCEPKYVSFSGDLRRFTAGPTNNHNQTKTTNALLPD